MIRIRFVKFIKFLVHVFQLPCESFIMGCQLFRLKLEIIICLIKSVRWVFFPILINWQLWNQLILSVLRCWLPACHAWVLLPAGGETGTPVVLFFLLSNKYPFILCLFNKMVTIQRIVHSGIVSGSWKRPTQWPGQQKKGHLVLEAETVALCELIIK